MFDIGQRGFEHFTGAAKLHFFFPGIAYGSVADGSVDEPAQITGGKLPGRTPLPLGGGAGLSGPARSYAIVAAQFSGEQKIELALNMHRDGTPALLVAMDGLDRRPQKLSHLFLGFVQFPAKYAEFFGLHGFRMPVAIACR
jgi:hypothetical protein